MLHWRLLHLLAVLHPGDGGRRPIESGLEGGGSAAGDGEGGGEGGEHGGVHLLPWHLHHQGAGGEALADIIEGLAGVTAGVLGEDLMDDQAVGLTRGLVLKVLARLDLLLVVKPEDVILIRSSCNRVSVGGKEPEI